MTLGGGRGRGVYVCTTARIASPPHSLFKLHSLDCDLTSSRLNRYDLLE
ncbi:MAG: hypothetical protein FWH20_04785 [Oscillospiraceae bacterium]|nr:hypothetical protein [Oscillospiraceae bacterium]